MQEKTPNKWRFYFLIALLIIAALGLVARIFFLGVVKHNFLLDQSKARSVREITVPAHRGMITDRNGEPLAISIPMASIWINPQMLMVSNQQLARIAHLLGSNVVTLRTNVLRHRTREFVYLKRGVPPDIAAKVLAMHVPGVFSQTEYRRYYPEGESTAQVIGFTNIDDRGQEGLELAYDAWLHGIPGKTRVVKDLLGNVIANLQEVSAPQQGHDLTLSIDRRVQYLACRELKNTVEKFTADSGSVVVLGVKTGEVIAMCNAPSFNPNNRVGVPVSYYRNRAVTDLFEPGSTMKAFSIASAIESGKYVHNSIVNTNPGVWNVDGHLIYDDKHRNNGVLTVTGVLQKSSDIGVAKMTLSLPLDRLPKFLQRFGFGQTTLSGFPGEASGTLPDHSQWRPFVIATLSFGYGISATALQLAEAYAVLASNGLLRPVSFLKHDQAVPGKQVLDAKVCKQMIAMLETVLDIGGTGTQAKIPGYHVAGKTGTAYIAGPNGYYSDRYYADFAGIAPVTDPKLVVVVVIKNPHGQYHGGMVAAPAFANIMEGSLRILGIPADDKNAVLNNEELRIKN